MNSGNDWPRAHDGEAAALIACSKSKAGAIGEVLPAEQQYIGKLLRAQLRYAREVLGLADDRIFVMSAKYGLVGIKDPIASYDMFLAQLSAAGRTSWAANVVLSLLRQVPAVDTAYVLAGKLYRELVTGELEVYGVEVVNPAPPGYGYALLVQWYCQA